MTYEELAKYWVPAADNLGVLHHRLDNILGVDEWCVGLELSGKPLPEDLRNLLVMLTGLHAYAILKMYRIKKGLEKA